MGGPVAPYYPWGEAILSIDYENEFGNFANFYIGNSNPAVGIAGRIFIINDEDIDHLVRRHPFDVFELFETQFPESIEISRKPVPDNVGTTGAILGLCLFGLVFLRRLIS